MFLIGGGGFILYKLYSDKAASPRSQTAKTAESGTLLVESVPEGADVKINSKPEGTTPTAIRNLPFGEELTVRIEKDGYQAFITPVLLSPQDPEFNLKVELKKK